MNKYDYLKRIAPKEDTSTSDYPTNISPVMVSISAGNVAQGATWTTTNTTSNTGSLSWGNVAPMTSFTSEDIVINRSNRTPLQVGRTLDAIMDRLCIIEPSFQLMDKYPALKEAYDAYKIIEDMCRAGDKEDE